MANPADGGSRLEPRVFIPSRSLPPSTEAFAGQQTLHSPARTPIAFEQGANEADKVYSTRVDRDS